MTAGTVTWSEVGAVVMAQGAGPRPPERQLGQPEVQDLRLAAVGQEDVRRLDVTMDDSLAVRAVERIGDLDADVDDLVGLQGPGREPIPKRLSLHQLHDDERVALVLADVVDRADVRVIQCGGRARLELEPIHGVGIVREFVMDELQRNGTAEANVFGSVDDAHAAFAQSTDDSIVRNRPSKHESPVPTERKTGFPIIPRLYGGAAQHQAVNPALRDGYFLRSKAGATSMETRRLLRRDVRAASRPEQAAGT